MVVKTFRGVLADGGQERIKLQTSAGKVGYRIVKFQVLPVDPSATAPESIVKIFKEEQATTVRTVNFTDNSLLGCAYFSGAAASSQPIDMVIIFDREIFNQDIFIDHFDNSATININYYLELEAIPLGSDEAALTTVKAMRGLAVD